MNYPIWELTTAGGGLLIALMAVVHVYVAHFAVGGGLYLVLLQRKAYAERSPEMLAYLKRHARFFLLLSMVFGGITGVGIWFTIALLNPAATTTLIHTFVFGWATEWVCFVGEIVAFDSNKGMAEILVKNKFAVGDRLEVIAPGGNRIIELQYMEDLHGQPMQEAAGGGYQVRIPLPPADYGRALLARYLAPTA